MVSQPRDVTRRAVFGLSAGAGMMVATTGLPALAAKSAALHTSAFSEWDNVQAAFDRATRAVVEYEKIYKPALKRITDGVGPMPPLWFDHTAYSGQTARIAVALSDADGSHPLPAHQAKAQEVALARKTWDERNSQYESEPAWVAIDRHMTLLDDAEHRARKALMREPSPHALALALKVRLALEADEFWEDERDALLADAKRFSL